MPCQCRISKGNIKLDLTPNLSLPPVATCADLPCLKEGCYAMKAWNCYPNVRASWSENLEYFQTEPTEFFNEVVLRIKIMRTKRYFRWHTGGEIPNQQYLDGMIRVAEELPEVKFLVFTKRYNLDFSAKPGNLEVIPSSWPGLKMPHAKIRRNGMSVAWMVDGKDKRRIRENAKNAFECPGSCTNCRVCWSASSLGKDVIFHKH